MRYVDLPEEVEYGGHRYRALPEREYLTVSMKLDAGGEAVATIKNPLDRHLLVDYWTGYCSNAAGLAAFRVALADQKDNTPQVIMPEVDTEAIAPRASLVMTDARGLAEARPLLIVLGRDVMRKVRVTGGTSGDTVEITFHVRELEPV